MCAIVDTVFMKSPVKPTLEACSVHCPKVIQISKMLHKVSIEENEILHEIFRVVSR